MNINTCPKWEKCNAPICPIDPDLSQRAMLSEDGVCFYMTEAVKNDAEAIFGRRGLGELFELISTLTPFMSDRWGRIRRKLEGAKTTGSRMARFNHQTMNCDEPKPTDHVGGCHARQG